MLKRNLLAQAVALAIVLPGISYAELELSGEAKIEYDMFTSDGRVTGASEDHEAYDALKSEYSIKLFMNTDFGEESSFHAELLLADDGEAASERLEGGEAYSQYEILREFYVDTSAAGIDFRLGKQQVVWGTADGIKLLDIINPTDYRELNQNVSEDSRIPVWMINAEKYFDSGDSFQVILSEAKPNFIAGLTDEDSEAGAPFTFLGVDTITGTTNGFLSIAEDMGRTSGVFETLLQMGGLSGLTGAMGATTVAGFTALGNAGAPSFQDVGGQLLGVNPGQIDPTSANGALVQVVFLPLMGSFGNGNVVLNQAANLSGSNLLPAFQGYLGQLQGGLIDAQTNTIVDGDAYTNSPTAVLDINQDGLADVNAIGQAFNELGRQMTLAVAQGMNVAIPNPADLTDVVNQAALGTIATNLGVDPTDPNAFNAAIQGAAIAGMQQTSFQDGSTNQFTGTLDTANPMSAFDYMGDTTFATFVNFIGMKTVYRREKPDDAGNLGLRYKGSTEGGVNYSVNYLYAYDPNPIVDLSWEDSLGNSLSYDAANTVLRNSDGTVFNVMTQGGSVLVFTESLERISNLGGSFDMALDGTSIPTVIRGEVLYTAGAKAPVIDKTGLSEGDIVASLKMLETDYFKYVLGIDLTVATNMLVSTQLIQMYNLDYIDEGNRYTGDFATMHLSNGMNKGDEVETFISFFLSKPFGSDVQHRWNNIIIAENGGGYWNRLDVDYSLNDEMVVTVEYNKYWGEEDTTFGQFEDSSNLQLGFKYIF